MRLQRKLDTKSAPLGRSGARSANENEMLENLYTSAGCIPGESKAGGGSNNKKDHAAGKNPRFPLSFCSFSKHVQNRRFCAEFGQKCVLKKEQKDQDFCLF